MVRDKTVESAVLLVSVSVRAVSVLPVQSAYTSLLTSSQLSVACSQGSTLLCHSTSCSPLFNTSPTLDVSHLRRYTLLVTRDTVFTLRYWVSSREKVNNKFVTIGSHQLELCNKFTLKAPHYKVDLVHLLHFPPLLSVEGLQP